MKDKPEPIRRRKILQYAAGVALSPAVLAPTTAAAPLAPPRAGRPGEFDFLAGSWKISHRRLKDVKTDEWDTFPGEATCWTILGGLGSVEELRIPARDFSGMGLRLLDVEKRIWSDFWVNGKSGVLTTPGVTGSFENGVGTFISEETEGGKTILARGVWDRITASSCRWHQATSKDGGKTWEPNWFMDWARA